MPENMTCFACEREPTQQCPRCGRPYCDEHGEDVCDACLEPASAIPSFTLYRGSLLALLIGTALAVWLILQPPGDSVNSAAAPLVVTPTDIPVVQTTPPAPTTTTAPGAGSTPGAQETPAASPTGPAGQETPEPGQTPPSAGTTTYTVQSGDTIGAICANLSTLPPEDCLDRVLELNSISDPAAIVVGETLTVPTQ